MPTVRGLLGVGWSRPAAPGADGPQPRDIVLVIVLAAAAVVEGAVRTDLTWPLATTLVTLAILPGLLWRRSRPLVVVAVMTVVTAGFTVARTVAGSSPTGLVTMFAVLSIPYAVFRWGSGRDRLVGGALLGLGVGLSIVLGGEGFAGAVAGVAFVGGACLIGALRRERVESRAGELDAVRAREREALARDLHDTVAHHVSAIAIRAQVAGAELPDVSRVAASLDVIEREAQAVLTDMRSLVRTLRAPAGYVPAAGLTELVDLADPGPPPVAVRVHAPDDLPDLVASTLFRIAQEGITNARRHARAATAIAVTVTVDAKSANILVHNDGAAARPSSGDGHGLRGISERTALLGGHVIAGPDPGGGWTLRAALPLRGAA
ncbi:sensor histidine kinase [Nocardia mangyaensis]|uniref:sensor histidine kinase n=1 Tax=Nocardia mangyaensis TaxID=2213200 RepID=UPI000B25A1B9|nr:histidine kinase [Nocardia mangyaensis]